ncbi:hypothetical protein EHS11_02510 [Leptospira ilyithenensis]|uniref:Uncharacterized protein n=1 Tax=Leptospira ilyithenensis TaxID=2484901 RepID=A0A4R9LS73_9LEPT|nr:hypothetical protein EHS11_02510 [Leptospira ilyithenensis]
MDEINWSEQNINLAQDRGNKLQQNALLKANGISDPDSLSPAERNRILGEIDNANEIKQLRASGKTDAEIAAMSRDQREAELDRINGEVNPETLAIAALASVGTFFGGALAYMGLGGGTGNGSTPPVRGQVVEVPARRREDGEDDAGLPVPDDGIIKTGDVSEPLKAAGGFNFAEQMALFFGGVDTEPTSGPNLDNIDRLTVKMQNSVVEKFIFEDRTKANAELEKIADPIAKQNAKEKLDQAITEWDNATTNQREAITERYLIQRYNLKTIDEVSTNSKAGDTPEKSGSFYKTTVKIVEGDVPDNPKQAAEMKDFRNKKHYESTQDNGDWKVDLNADYNAGNDMMWFGPNTKFKVLDVKIEGHPEFGDSVDKYHGTKIQIGLLDANGNITSTADIVHMTTINNKLIEAYRNPGTVLDAGTWMGGTPKKIGNTTGPHLHIASYDADGVTQIKRKDFYSHWKGRKNK